jgi:hypothetical protein
MLQALDKALTEIETSLAKVGVVRTRKGEAPSRLATNVEIAKARNVSNIAGIPYREALAVTIKRADRMASATETVGSVRRAESYYHLPIEEK